MRMTLSQYELAWGMSTCGKSIEEFIFEMMESENINLIEQNGQLKDLLRRTEYYIPDQANVLLEKIEQALKQTHNVSTSELRCIIKQRIELLRPFYRVNTDIEIIFLESLLARI